MSKGILTIATGKAKYINMAIALAKSLRINSPGWPIALVTDQQDPKFSNYFDHVVYNANSPSGFVQKTLIYDLSPFEETLFIDCDCLIYKDLSPLFSYLQQQEVSAIGIKVHSGNWIHPNVEELLEKEGLPYLIMHNGGIYYFRKSDLASKVFARAKDYLVRYDEIGFNKLRDKKAHEPLMTCSMSYFNLEPLNNAEIDMRTLVGVSQSPDIDVLLQKSDLTIGTGDRSYPAQPSIIHYCGIYRFGYYYKRDVLKIKLFEILPFGKRATSKLVDLIGNPLYIGFVFAYRMYKLLIFGRSFPSKSLMPVLKYL